MGEHQPRFLAIFLYIVQACVSRFQVVHVGGNRVFSYPPECQPAIDFVCAAVEGGHT